MKRTHLLLATALLGAVLSTATLAGAAMDGPDGDNVSRLAVVEPVVLAETFTYQGRLTDGSSPANGSFDLRFILFDAESGGAQVGDTDVVDNVTVTNGLFTVEIGFGDGAFDGDARWMEIAVRPGASAGSYTVLSPRQPITAVPNALYAKSAGGVVAPATINGEAAALESVLTVGQEGAGQAIHATRAGSGSSTNPTIYGVNAGSGAGVLGDNTYPDGLGYGVMGRATGPEGIGGSFKGTVAGVEIDGALKVTGTTPTAWVHTANNTNDCNAGKGTFLSSPLLAGDGAAIVVVTLAPLNDLAVPAIGTYGVTFDDGGLGCDTGSWVITAENAIPSGTKFNVIVIKQ